jgi:hypothetical protein
MQTVTSSLMESVMPTVNETQKVSETSLQKPTD